MRETFQNYRRSWFFENLFDNFLYRCFGNVCVVVKYKTNKLCKLSINLCGRDQFSYYIYIVNYEIFHTHKFGVQQFNKETFETESLFEFFKKKKRLKSIYCMEGKIGSLLPNPTHGKKVG